MAGMDEKVKEKQVMMGYRVPANVAKIVDLTAMKNHITSSRLVGILIEQWALGNLEVKLDLIPTKPKEHDEQDKEATNASDN